VRKRAINELETGAFGKYRFLY